MCKHKAPFLDALQSRRSCNLERALHRVTSCIAAAIAWLVSRFRGVGSTYGVATVSRIDHIKFEVSFAEYSLFYRALFQKRLNIIPILLTEGTP